MTVHVVISGDSIAGSATRWPYHWMSIDSFGDSGIPVMQMAATYVFQGNILVRNMAISGSRLNLSGLPDAVPLATFYVDPVVTTKRTGDTYVFVCAIGTNDGALGGLGSVAAYAAAVGTFIQNRKSAGFDKAIICTLIPRGDGVLLEPDRAEYNSTVKGASFLDTYGIDAACDFASDVIMGDFASTANTTWFDVDTIHPTSAGSARMAPYFTAVMQSLGLQT